MAECPDGPNLILRECVRVRAGKGDGVETGPMEDCEVMFWATSQILKTQGLHQSEQQELAR